MDNKVLIDMKKAIGNHLRYIRETHGYTMDNMISITGLGISRLQQIEKMDISEMRERNE